MNASAQGRFTKEPIALLASAWDRSVSPLTLAPSDPFLPLFGNSTSDQGTAIGWPAAVITRTKSV